MALNHIDEVGYEREGRKGTTIHLPNPATEKPVYYTSIAERMFNMELETAKSLPFVSVVQH